MNELVPYSKRHWKFNARVVSLELKGGGIVKPHDRFYEHCTDEDLFGGLMEACYQMDVTRPSSYADIFYQSCYQQHIVWTYNSLLINYFAGGWQQAKKRGVISGKWKRYDINRAYFWSLQQGLPDPGTFRFLKEPSCSDVAGTATPGVFVVSLTKPRLSLPYPFNSRRRAYLASTEEIEAYSLPVKRFHSGVVYDREPNRAPRLADVILSLPASRQIGRSFWGRWASRSPVQCCMASGKKWSLNNVYTNVVWAHLIASRVKLRIWKDAIGAAHVFVDSIITNKELPVGTEPGQWRHEATYNGLDIKGPGIYGSPGGPLIKHSGTN